MLEVKFSSQAVKFLKKSDKELVRRIFDKIQQIKKDPILSDSKRIQNTQDKLFRVRIGNYRLLYEINYSNNLVGIVKIDKRSRVYD